MKFLLNRKNCLGKDILVEGRWEQHKSIPRKGRKNLRQQPFVHKSSINFLATFKLAKWYKSNITLRDFQSLYVA